MLLKENTALRQELQSDNLKSNGHSENSQRLCEIPLAKHTQKFISDELSPSPSPSSQSRGGLELNGTKNGREYPTGRPSKFSNSSSGGSNELQQVFGATSGTVGGDGWWQPNEGEEIVPRDNVRRSFSSGRVSSDGQQVSEDGFSGRQRKERYDRQR